MSGHSEMPTNTGADHPAREHTQAASSRADNWSRVGVIVSTALGLVGIAAGLGWLHSFRQINRVTSQELAPAFEASPDCFTRPRGTLRFSLNRDHETRWVQCKTPNALSSSSTYRFNLSKLDGLDADLRIVGLVGTFGIEVFSFQNGGLAHWVVRLDGKPICTIPQNGAKLEISTVSVGPGDCELVEEVRPELGESHLLTIDQVVDAQRTGEHPLLFAGIVRPALELQKR